MYKYNCGYGYMRKSTNYVPTQPVPQPSRGKRFYTLRKKPSESPEQEIKAKKCSPLIETPKKVAEAQKKVTEVTDLKVTQSYGMD